MPGFSKKEKETVEEELVNRENTTISCTGYAGN
jgi:hypothetical protein